MSVRPDMVLGGVSHWLWLFVVFAKHALGMIFCHIGLLYTFTLTRSL